MTTPVTRYAGPTVIGGGFAAADGLGVPRMLRGRPSGLKDRYALAARRPAAVLDPGDLCGPWRAVKRGQAKGLPRRTRGTRSRSENRKIIYRVPATEDQQPDRLNVKARAHDAGMQESQPPTNSEDSGGAGSRSDLPTN